MSGGRCLFFLVATGLLVSACDSQAINIVGSPESPSYDWIEPPGPGDPEDWTQEEWEQAWPTAPFEILEAQILTAGYGWEANPTFGLFTQISRPFGLLVNNQARAEYLATMSIDGNPGIEWAGDAFFHSVPDGIRITEEALPQIDCMSIEDHAKWTVVSRHYGLWEHWTYPLLTRQEGPEQREWEAECYKEGDGDDDPPVPPTGGGGSDGDDCTTYMVTIYEWNGTEWEYVTHYYFTSCQ